MTSLFGTFAADRAAATTYYVDVRDGSDAHDGTSRAKAWRSLARVSEAALEPGDSVLLKRGERWQGLLTINMSGRPGQPITFAAYGEGPAPIISGAESGISSAGTEHIVLEDLHIHGTQASAIYVERSHHWRMNRLTIDGTGDGQNGGGITWWHGNDLTVSNSALTNVTGDGIWAWDVDGLRILNNRIMTVRGPYADNLHFYMPRHFEIRGNYFSMEGRTDSGKGNVLIFGGHHGTIANNIFKGGGYGISTTSSNLTVTNNQFFNHNKYKWSAGIMVGEVLNVVDNVYTGNVVKNAVMGIYVFNDKFTRRDFVIRNNLFEDVDRAALVVESPISGAFSNNEIRSRWAVRPVVFSSSVIRGERWNASDNVVTRTARE